MSLCYVMFAFVQKNTQIARNKYYCVTDHTWHLSVRRRLSWCHWWAKYWILLCPKLIAFLRWRPRVKWTQRRRKWLRNQLGSWSLSSLTGSGNYRQLRPRCDHYSTFRKIGLLIEWPSESFLLQCQGSWFFFIQYGRSSQCGSVKVFPINPSLRR